MPSVIDFLRYPDKRDIFFHPKTKERFEELVIQMNRFNVIDDCQGVYMTAMQLIAMVPTYKDDGIEFCECKRTEFIECGVCAKPIKSELTEE